MIKRVDPGAAGSVPQSEPQETKSTEAQESVKSTSSPEEKATLQTSEKAGLAAGGSARIAEQGLAGKLLASQLQSQIQPTEKQGTPVGSATVEKPLLVEGSTGPEVKNTQQQLNQWRERNGLEPLKEDGIFGPKTKAAVLQFQEANGLKKDGIVGGNTRDRLTLENNENFQKLNPDTQNQVRDMMNNAQKDPATRQLLLTVATDENFGKLPRAAQDAGLQNLGATASGIAEKNLQGMSNDQLLKLAESPAGAEQLAAMKSALQQGPITPSQQKELDRINSATFRPADGLKLKGSAADQAAYLHMVRREMLTSPTFAKTMNEINADKAHPVKVNIGRDMPNVRLDVDRGGGTQDIDLNDFDKLPDKPGASNPNAITQGEVLSHAMREARQAALGQKHPEAHAAAINEENEYRKEIGQKTFRKAPPNDEDRKDNELGDVDLIIHFEGAPDEVLKFDQKSRLQR